MTKGERTRLVWTVSIGSLLWMVAAAIVLFGVMDAEVTNHSSAVVKDRMAAECLGTFKDRYDCKEAIIVQSGRDTFWSMSWRFLTVIVPALTASFWLSSYLRKHPVQLVEHRQADDNGDWKSRAKFHTQVQSPQQAAEDLHVEDVPASSHGAKHLIDEIAPVDDWKSRAQNQISKAKRPDQ
ncbi:hypothetical protein [Magnetospirillum sulfuroxidans]|uniref:Transmembrane protein n=1 Tax=Magnetospirillum sulfuroxidans TaxID=611300 RepID=A0ABS5IGS2_9PROT|nr:hypothetical protein [Magnetospirillum sulfuroxidans]MBR9973631.1 hypothetical protein [Magnetospirillum sulfuroxidans]